MDDDDSLIKRARMLHKKIEKDQGEDDLDFDQDDEGDKNKGEDSQIEEELDEE